MSSPLITPKENKLSSQTINSTKRLSRRQKQRKHTYHELYIDLQDSINLQNKADEHLKIPCTQLNIDTINMKNSFQNSEKIEIDKQHNQPQNNNVQIAANTVLGSYAELKAWTHATNASVKDMKVLGTFLYTL